MKQKRWERNKIKKEYRMKTTIIEKDTSEKKWKEVDYR